MRKKTLPALLAALTVSGCATWGPTWSEITGDRFNAAIEFRRPAIIERVGDQGAFVSNPIKASPGPTRVVISAPAPGWSGGSPLEVIQIDMKPCVRYYVNAQFRNNIERDFRPVIDHEESVPGCQIKTAAK